MSDLYWPTDEQLARLEPYFLKSLGKQWAALAGRPAVYGLHKTLQSLEAMERGAIRRLGASKSRSRRDVIPKPANSTRSSS